MGIQTDFISVGAVGTTQTSGAASARVALPVTANGSAPKYVRLQADAFLYVKLGDSTVVATANDMMLSPNAPEYVAVSGFTNIAYLQLTAAARLNVIPLEG